jgi:hypothetical protein
MDIPRYTPVRQSQGLSEAELTHIDAKTTTGINLQVLNSAGLALEAQNEKHTIRN